MRTLKFLFVFLLTVQVSTAQELFPNSIEEYLHIEDTATWNSLYGTLSLYAARELPTIGPDSTLVLNSDLVYGVYDPNMNIRARFNINMPIIEGSLQPMDTPDGWLMVVRSADSCPNGCQDPGDTLLALSHNMLPIDTCWTDGWFKRPDHTGTYTVPVVIDGHDDMSFNWNNEVYYLIIGYSERLVRYSDFGLTCSEEFFEADLTSLYLFKAGPGPGEFVAMYEPWQFMTPQNLTCGQTSVRWPHINRLSHNDLRPFMTDTSITFSISGRNESSVHNVTYFLGDSIMHPNYIFGEPYVFNTHINHEYENVFINTVDGNSLTAIHGAGIFRTDSSDLVAVHNNNSFTGLESESTLLEVKNGEARTLWSIPNQGYREFCCGDAQILQDNIVMYQRGRGTLLDYGGIPISDALDDNILEQFPEYSFFDFQGNLIAEIDFPGWEKGTLVYVPTEEWLPEIDSAVVMINGPEATITYPEVRTWEDWDRNVLATDNQVTVPTTQADSTLGWEPVGVLLEWRIPFKTESVITEVAEETGASFMVYPNPLRDEILQVRIGDEVLNDYQIYSVNGQEVRREDMTSGVYTIRVNYDNQIYTKRLIVM